MTEKQVSSVKNLLLVTYTEKAAGEMKDRIRDILEKADCLPPDFDEVVAVVTRLLLVPGGPLVLEDGQTTRLRRLPRRSTAFGCTRIWMSGLYLVCYDGDLDAFVEALLETPLHADLMLAGIPAREVSHGEA